MEEAKFEKGEDVMYLDKGTGQQLPAVVRSIDYNCDPLSYTVHIPSLSSTRETVESRLTRVNQAPKANPGKPEKDAQAVPAPRQESMWEQFEDQQQPLQGETEHHHQQQQQQEAGQAHVPSQSHAKKHHKSHHQHPKNHAGGVDGAAVAAGSAGHQLGTAPGVEGQAAKGAEQLHTQHNHSQQQQQQQQQPRHQAPPQVIAADSVAYPQIHHHQQAHPAAHAPHPHNTKGPAGRAGQQPQQQQPAQQHQQQAPAGPSRRQQLRSSLPSWLGGAS